MVLHFYQQHISYGRSEEYTTFIEENSGERAKYNEKKGLFEK